LCYVCFSDAKIATVSHSEALHDYQLSVDTNDDSCKLPQCNGTSLPGPDVRLTVVNVDSKDDAEIVECQLETAKHSSVSFKFNCFTDKPSDVAASLVCQTLLVSPLIIAALLHAHNCFIDCFPFVSSWFSSDFSHDLQ